MSRPKRAATLRVNWTRVLGMLGFLVALVYWGYLLSRQAPPAIDVVVLLTLLHVVSAAAWAGDRQ